MTSDLTQLREDTAKPIAREIIKLIGELSSEIMIGEFDVDKGREAYQKIVGERILPILQEKNIRTFDLSYILKLVLQPVTIINQMITDSVEVAEDEAVAMKFGVKDVKDMRFSHIIQAQLEEKERQEKAKNGDNPVDGMVVNPKDLA